VIVGFGCLFLLAIALLSAPLIDRIQRLSRPVVDAEALAPSVAAETALTARPPSLPVGNLSRTPVPTGAGRSLPRLPARAPSPTAAPDQTVVAADQPVVEPPPGFGEPTWLTIPAIELDSPIDPVGVSDGYYQTAPFRVGHHADSVPPGAFGNSIFNGHVTSLTDGRVFARLTEVEQNATVAIYTATHRTDWAVVAAGWVAADEDWYIQPTQDVRVTLYTCGGDFDFVRRDYSHRYVVIAAYLRAVPLESGDE
jgi:hypothetical protein